MFFQEKRKFSDALLETCRAHFQLANVPENYIENCEHRRHSIANVARLHAGIVCRAKTKIKQVKLFIVGSDNVTVVASIPVLCCLSQ